MTGRALPVVTAECTGHCCKSFTFHEDPDLLELKLLRAQDGAYIRDMLIYLGPAEEHAAESSDPDDPFVGHAYTCRHYDIEAGRCKEYESRPAMCREYPYNRTCRYVGCTLKVEEPIVEEDVAALCLTAEEI